LEAVIHTASPFHFVSLSHSPSFSSPRSTSVNLVLI
jgi:hypothetical protein